VKLPAAIRLARRATRTIHQNVTLSLATVAVLVAAALTGRLSLTSGLLLNEGTALLIIAQRPAAAAPREGWLDAYPGPPRPACSKRSRGPSWAKG
jgi:Zn2+/Cd2+-exporting ATPase